MGQLRFATTVDTYRRNAALRGVPTPVLQAWLGHRSLAETERYVQLAGGHHSWWVERLQGTAMDPAPPQEALSAAAVQWPATFKGVA